MHRFADLVERIRRTPGPVRLVGVDGCGGSGKTTFAARLAAAAGDAPVVHTDDFASWEEPLDWWPRFDALVITPLLDRKPASFHPYDWVARRASRDVLTVPPADLVVVEGVGATRAAWRDRLTLRIWVEADAELRLRRGLERDGAHMLGFWQWWQAEEDRYVAEEQPQRHADVVVDGAPSAPHAAEREYVRVIS